jgi:hypothetical protein
MSSSASLFCVPADALDRVWPLVRPWVKAATDKTDGWWGPDDVRAACERGHAVLWVVLDDSRARAAVVTEIHEGWRQRVGRISVLGGEGFRHWRHLIAELEMWAKAQGANRMEIMGRDWSKVLGRDGYVKTATVVRKPL